MANKEEDWKWWVGHDDERYHTECETKEEAVYIASKEQEGGYIVEALKPEDIKISQYFDGSTFVENAEDHAFEDHGDPDGDVSVFPVTTDQKKDLQDMVRSALDAWQEKHGLKFVGFQFADSRNHEYIPQAKDEST